MRSVPPLLALLRAQHIEIKKFVSLQLDSIIDEVVFESKEDDDDEGKVKMAGTEGKRIVHVTQCSAE